MATPRKPKAPRRDKQQRIPGTFDKIPKAVQDKIDTYLEAKRQISAWRESFNSSKQELIDIMLEKGLTEILIDDEEKILRLVDDRKLKIEARKSQEQQDAEEEAFS